MLRKEGNLISVVHFSSLMGNHIVKNFQEYPNQAIQNMTCPYARACGGVGGEDG